MSLSINGNRNNSAKNIAEKSRVSIRNVREDTNEEIDYTFTFGEAKRAGLCRTSMWTGFTKRMVYYRTLGFVCRDLFSDVLMGMYLTEELQNERQIEAGAIPAPVAEPEAPEAPAADLLLESPADLEGAGGNAARAGADEQVSSIRRHAPSPFLAWARTASTCLGIETSTSLPPARTADV
jgi:hypothetical protein